ncbi:DUF6933 domain-containing protein [Candidatus Tisiphia endosymbiont of Nemotelus uliginosus]|uniref:DUF6933 domain-containing protein n=1 Tax=Candidatus Tisiphia endosymbiont of Nemotelus uliginosus TaxID=3077926 RepID=UPI0035C91E26
MPQLRLTAKMAKELKILELKNLNNCTALYDDWYVDVVRILRKKIFIFMHIHTRIALAIPSYEIGGIHNLFKCFPLLINEFLHLLNYGKIANESYDFFSCPQSQFNFVKTNDKSTLRYVSDFKLILEITAEKYQKISQLLCDNTSERWLERLIKDNSQINAYTTPLKLLKKLLD